MSSHGERGGSRIGAAIMWGILVIFLAAFLTPIVVSLWRSL